MIKFYKIFALFLILILSNRYALANENHLIGVYKNWKEMLKKEIGLSYDFDLSILGQRVSPNGKGTSFQTQYFSDLDWQMFLSDKFGAGSLQFSYTYVQYWGKSAKSLGAKIGVVNFINDYSNNSYEFDQLSYTHRLAGFLKNFSFTIGQFPIYTWDGTEYNSNQQINFINESLAQNASSAYPTASIGGYLSFSPQEEINFILGFQDANNSSGSKIRTSSFHKKQFTSFFVFSFAPRIKNFGDGEYSILLYNQPWTLDNPETVNGFSLNFSQYLSEKTAIFARINATSGKSTEISQSYVLGGVLNNPFNRNLLDQLGIAVATNKINITNKSSYETVLESYLSFGLSDFCILTPDFQFYINPAQEDKKNFASVMSLRATFLF